MIYRRKVYHVHPSIVENFNEHFQYTLMPAHLKYGARLVGRWMTDEINDKVEIFAIWEYETMDDIKKLKQRLRVIRSI